MLLAEVFGNGLNNKLLIILVVIILVLFLLLYVITKWTNKKQNKKEVNNQEKKPKPEKVKKQKKEKKEKVKKVKKTKQEEQAPEEDEDYTTNTDSYVSPLILDRQKYEIALQEKLAKEKQERLNRQAAETARLEALKNKEFQSHAGFITTLQRFSKKDALERQISETGKVDREMLDTYLNEKGTTISEEFSNMSPELKAVILSDLMNRKY